MYLNNPSGSMGEAQGVGRTGTCFGRRRACGGACCGLLFRVWVSPLPSRQSAILLSFESPRGSF